MKFEDARLEDMLTLDDAIQHKLLALAEDLQRMAPEQPSHHRPLEAVLRMIPRVTLEDLRTRISFMLEKYEELKVKREQVAGDDQKWPVPHPVQSLLRFGLDLQEFEMAEAA